MENQNIPLITFLRPDLISAHLPPGAKDFAIFSVHILKNDYFFLYENTSTNTFSSFSNQKDNVKQSNSLNNACNDPV